MPYDPARHHRRSIRLPGYDYTQPGAYFVTICTQGREPILSDLAAPGPVLSPVGQIVERCWLALPHHFARVVLDGLVIMPDHLHGVIMLAPLSADAPAVTASVSGTRPASLAAVVQNFKSVSTRRVNQMRRTVGAALWQRNYYERILRSDAELIVARRYIAGNPARALARRPSGRSLRRPAPGATVREADDTAPRRGLYSLAGRRATGANTRGAP